MQFIGATYIQITHGTGPLAPPSGYVANDLLLLYGPSMLGPSSGWQLLGLDTRSSRHSAWWRKATGTGADTPTVIPGSSMAAYRGVSRPFAQTGNFPEGDANESNNWTGVLPPIALPVVVVFAAASLSNPALASPLVQDANSNFPNPPGSFVGTEYVAWGHDFASSGQISPSFSSPWTNAGYEWWGQAVACASSSGLTMLV